MNQNPTTLALAIVHQVVQASELQEAREALQAQAEHLKEAQKAIDTLVSDREVTKKAHAEHLEQIGKQIAAEQEALRQAHVEMNKTLRRVAKALEFNSVESMMDVVNSRQPLTQAPAPVESEGGEPA